MSFLYLFGRCYHFFSYLVVNFFLLEGRRKFVFGELYGKRPELIAKQYSVHNERSSRDSQCFFQLFCSCNISFCCGDKKRHENDKSALYSSQGVEMCWANGHKYSGI